MKTIALLLPLLGTTQDNPFGTYEKWPAELKGLRLADGKAMLTHDRWGIPGRAGRRAGALSRQRDSSFRRMAASISRNAAMSPVTSSNSFSRAS